MKKIIVLAAAVAIALGGGGVAKAKGDYIVNRISGATRYETSINVGSNYSNDKFENVIIASGNNFPDALAGSVLSKKLNAPILLVDKDVDSSMSTINFIKNKISSNGTIYILGGEGSVEKSFEHYFNSIGCKNIKRLGGVDRFHTNSLIVNSLNTQKGTPVVIVNGYGFADALSISSIAASKGYPIIMSNSNQLPNETKEMLKSITPSKVFIIGGNASIENSVINELKNTISSLNSNSIIRIWGNNRYETSLNICKYFNLPSETAVIANGENFPDALSGSSLAAKVDAPIILTDGANIASQKEYLDANNYKKLILLGGDAAINKEVEYILENKPVISNEDAKELLLNGDEAFNKMLKIDVDGKNYIDLHGTSFAKINADINSYGSIYDYLNKNYSLNKYYSDAFMKNMVDFVFTNIDGKYYMRYGNPEPAINLKNAEIVDKKYKENKVEVSVKGYYYESEPSYVKAILVYDGQKWVVDEFHNWF